MFDPFTTGPLASIGKEEDRAFLLGNVPTTVHFIAKITRRSINCYNLVWLDNRRRTFSPTDGAGNEYFNTIRDEFLINGIEVPCPETLRESDVDGWVQFGVSEAKKLGLKVSHDFGPRWKPFLTRRFDAALQLASALHHSQRRKGTDIPYISHLMAVSAMVLEAGGDEDQAIAALLHDAVEDQGGAATLNTIRRIFGDRVANAISECSDTDIEPKPPWRERKKAYLAHLKTASDDALIISVADKLHNARAIVADYRAVGEDLWKRFNATKEDEVWYYEELAKVFQERTKGALVDEFSGVVKELKQLTNSHKNKL